MEKITGNEPVTALCNENGVMPFYNGVNNVDGIGLTIRQHFAAMTMQGMLSNPSEFDVTTGSILELLGLPKDTKYDYNQHYFAYIAKKSVLQADALINELNQPQL